jgi:hypothetical protein
LALALVDGAAALVASDLALRSAWGCGSAALGCMAAVARTRRDW